jgi:4a-hydroxytetrahydrobiopterin dehydratase
MAVRVLDQQAINAALATLHVGWTGRTDGLRRSIEFADFATAVEFIVRIAAHAEELDHHPDLDLRWRRVDVALATHSAGGVTEADVKLAGIVDGVAAGLPQAT